jgi:alkylhydroperoxidase family enzyme
MEDPELVAAVLADWTTADISPELRATLGFVRKQTLDPDALVADDLAAVRAAGASEEQIRDAIYIAGGFHVLTRMADAFGAVPIDTLLDDEARAEYNAAFLARGYVAR